MEGRKLKPKRFGEAILTGGVLILCLSGPVLYWVMKVNHWLDTCFIDDCSPYEHEWPWVIGLLPVIMGCVFILRCSQLVVLWAKKTMEKRGRHE